jgi:hypothetical protein
LSTIIKDLIIEYCLLKINGRQATVMADNIIGSPGHILARIHFEFVASKAMLGIRRACNQFGPFVIGAGNDKDELVHTPDTSHTGHIQVGFYNYSS